MRAMILLRFGWGCVDVYRCVIIAFLSLYRPILHIDSHNRQRLPVANNPQSYRDAFGLDIPLLMYSQCPGRRGSRRLPGQEHHKPPYLIFANPSLFAAKHLPSAYESTTATLEPLTDRNSRSRSHCGGHVLQERVLGRATFFHPRKGNPACQEMGVAMSIATVQPLTCW